MAQGFGPEGPQGHGRRHQDGAVRLALGMPLIKELEAGLWEVRSHLSQGVARIIFTVAEGTMVLLHGFIKKSQKIPPTDLRIARQRLAALSKE